MRVLDLFSGIGGMSLGLEAAGDFETVAFCEFEDFPRKVLAKHWPDVPCYPDVRELTKEVLIHDGILAQSGHRTGRSIGIAGERNHAAGERTAGTSEAVRPGEDANQTNRTSPATIDLICGGYPCQPFSHAGKREGAGDDRHLWPEMFRLIETIRPRWVLAENVAGHISMGLDDVLSDLEDAGYEWWTFVIPACAVDAKHRRDRVWIVANAGIGRFSQPNGGQDQQPGRAETECGSEDVADSDQRIQHCGIDDRQQEGSEAVAPDRAIQSGNSDVVKRGLWPTEPAVGRVAHGVSARVDRLKSLGNAVVPQVVEQIGRAIMAAEA